MSLLIANRGRCPRESIELIGLTTKRDDASTIGQFGSGTAFAVALALREGMTVKISSEDDDGPFIMEPWLDTNDRIHWRFRPGSPLVKTWWHTLTSAVGRAKSVPTSFTSGFGGVDWKGVFPVAREFITNARDADPAAYRVWNTIPDACENEEMQEYLEMAESTGADGVTLVEIDGGGIQQIAIDWDWHFRFECGLVGHVSDVKDVYRVSPLMALMEPPEDGELLVFVKGVRIPHSIKRKALFSYSVDTAITEARTLSSEWSFRWSAAYLVDRALGELGPEFGAKLLRWIQENPKSIEASFDEIVLTYDGRWKTAFQSAYGSGTPVCTVLDNVKDGVNMPTTWATALKKDGVRGIRRPLGPHGSNTTTVWTAAQDRRDGPELALEVINHYRRCINGEFNPSVDGLRLTEIDLDYLERELEIAP